MIPKEIFKKIRQIEITTNRVVTDLFAGQYHSVFKGQGLEFDEVREYNVGDDIRSIDWNVTARTGKPHIKKFVEERELRVMVMVDASFSTRFGSVNQLKSTLAAELASVLATAAIRNNDKVGLIIFTDQIEKYIPPRKGLQHVLRVVREILYFQPKGKGTDMNMALDYLNKVTNHKAVTFLLSDFLENKGLEEEYSFVRSMSVTNKRHDLIAITLNDPREADLFDLGILELEDPETGELAFVDTSSELFKREYSDRRKNYEAYRSQLFHRLGVDHIDVHTNQPYIKPLSRFFKERQQRLRRE